MLLQDCLKSGHFMDPFFGWLMVVVFKRSLVWDFCEKETFYITCWKIQLGLKSSQNTGLAGGPRGSQTRGHNPMWGRLIDKWSCEKNSQFAFSFPSFVVQIIIVNIEDKLYVLILYFEMLADVIFNHTTFKWTSTYYFSLFPILSRKQ